MASKARQLSLFDPAILWAAVVESLKKLSTFMLEKLQWLEKPVNVREMVDLSYLPR